ncbi:L-type lectin-domain containing receptor kinase VII.1 [Thalictrum thalictroides]|uniref:non-specific serine/threonine protein kinase n=1 Tax=Thalictrum thalictroides TaxID=46969 RepID=A0A7J6V8C4_THATH|nr:L-type lectin-domain containing receptor kinase VII.1 [Thalictrum thalictroides]
MASLHFLFPFLLLTQILSFQFSFAIEFVYNSFNSKDILYYGNATTNSHVISLTSESPFSIGRVLYPFKIHTRSSNSSNLLLPFSTSFIFSISRLKNVLPGHGLVFIFTPHVGIEGTSSAQHLGLFNRTNDGDQNNHVLGIEFDLFKNQEFNDIDANHVGVDVNSLSSIAAEPAGYWNDEKEGLFEELELNNGVNYQVWIDYLNFELNVSMAPVGVSRPRKPLINVSINLSNVFLDEMYVGFTAATGRLVESHRILAWSFSNSNVNVGELLNTSHLPSFVPRGESIFHSKGFVAGMVVAIFCVLCLSIWISVILVKEKQRKRKLRAEMEEWELEYWPHRMNYQDMNVATNGFSEENVIGFGGNGKVYKGVVGGVEVAVKQFAHESEEGVRGFLAEVSSLGRLKHRNLVGLRGWCKREKGSLILVYDYMENGSLDKRLFECEESFMLNWEDRLRVLRDVAAGVLYLHEGWESRVLHRDIKASNVLLDKDMNGRLGDFGLARMHGHGEAASTTRVIGTVGYMAPEIVRNGKASAQTDVFGFGILVLEVVSGRRPIEDGKPHLVDWIWGLMEQGTLVHAVDKRLMAKGGFDEEEVEKFLHLGLLCAYPDPNSRPTMRQVVKLLEKKLDNEESAEQEGVEVYMLDKAKTTAMWFKYRRSFHHRKHPTFEDIRQSLSTSMSLPWTESDVIVEGR